MYLALGVASVLGYPFVVQFHGEAANFAPELGTQEQAEVAVEGVGADVEQLAHFFTLERQISTLLRLGRCSLAFDVKH